MEKDYQWSRDFSTFMELTELQRGLKSDYTGNNAGQFSGFPDSSVGKEFSCNVGDLGSNLGLGRSPGEGKIYPLQYSGLEIPWTTVHGVTKSRIPLSDFHSFNAGQVGVRYGIKIQGAV